MANHNQTDPAVFVYSHGNHSAQIRHDYGDRVRLGKVWEEKLTAAKKGEGSPHHTRHLMEAIIAKQAYDMAWMLERQDMMWREIEMVEELFRRVGVVEGAYGHVMAVVNKTTLAEALNASVSNMLTMHRRHTADAEARHAAKTAPRDANTGGTDES